MRFSKALLFVVFALLGSMGAAQATVQIHIDLSSQRMHVESSKGSYTWAVSTARSGYATPRGSYAPTSLQRMHYSRKYHMSPMPHSIFFNGGYAIHGTYATGALGRPASHGCVRLAPGNAAALYKMVQAEGGSISITGSPPRGTRYAARGGHHRHLATLRGHRGQPMAYAPNRSRSAGSVRTWQASPVSSLFGF